MGFGPEQMAYAISILKQTKERRGLSHNQLSQVSGVAQSHISNILNRDAEPSIEVLNKLFRALGYPLEEILHEVQSDSPTELHGYLATPLTGLTDDEDRNLREIVSRIRAVASEFSDPGLSLYWPGEHTHPKDNPDFTADQVYLMDRSRASTNDFIVILCAAPSYGVGQENEISTQAGLPAVRITPSSLSRMMKGSFLRATDVSYTGNLSGGITLGEKGEEALRDGFREIVRAHYTNRLYNRMNGNEFGDRLRKLIDVRHGNYENFSSELGISLSYLHCLFDEPFRVSNPSALLLKRLALRLDVSVGFLMGETAADELLVEGRRAWRSWIDSAGATVSAAGAIAIKNEWEWDYQRARSGAGELAGMSSNRETDLRKPMTEARWQRLYDAWLRKQRKAVK